MEKVRVSESLFDLVELVAKLRGPGGCPWDAKQTDSSIRLYLLEEAYEVIDAVEKEAGDEVCEELGDLFFQIIFLASLAEERKEFDLVDVMDRIYQKMVSRHPHVFGSVKVKTPEEVADNWHRIKEIENGKKKIPQTPFDSIPLNLPALMRTHRLCERASKAELKKGEASDVIDNLEGYFEKIKNAVEFDEKLDDGVYAKLLFNFVDLIRIQGGNAEDLLREENLKFQENITSGKPENKRD